MSTEKTTAKQKAEAVMAGQSVPVDPPSQPPAPSARPAPSQPPAAARRGTQPPPSPPGPATESTGPATGSPAQPPAARPAPSGQSALAPNVRADNVLNGTQPTTRGVTGGAQTRASQIQFSGFERVVDSLFVFDVDVALEQILGALRLSNRPSRTDYGSLVDALDEAQEVARVALQLVANAQVAQKNYEADVGVIRGELREQCVVELKGEGVTRPTLADIEARMASSFHDEYRDIEQRLQKAKSMVEYLEGLAARCAERARDLRQMVSSCRNAS
jgi:phage baseplate assembly protein W